MPKTQDKGRKREFQLIGSSGDGDLSVEPSPDHRNPELGPCGPETLKSTGVLTCGKMKRMAGAIDIGSGRQLFLDDWLIQSREGVSLTVNRPAKTGELLLTADKAWEASHLGAYKTILDDGGLYRLWYDASTSLAEKGLILCYAYSVDRGKTWVKPNLGLVDFGGSSQNNIVYAPPGHPYGQCHGPTVHKDPNEPEGSPKKYKMFYWMDRHEESARMSDTIRKTNAGRERRDQFAPDHTRSPRQCMGFAFSPDGLRWTPWDRNPVMRNFGDTQNVFFWDDQRQKYVAYTRVWDPWRKVGRSETSDLARWPDPEVIVGYDEKDPENTDLYNNACIKYPYAQNAYFMFPSVFHREQGERHRNGTLDIQLAVSRDGILWDRPSREPFIRLGLEGSFDSQSIYVAAGLTREGDQLSIYYTGYDTHHGELRPNSGVMSRAIMRVDGFMSADAGYRGGFLVTKPIVFSGGRLELNFDASAGGEVRAEIQKPDGEPIPGYALEDAKPMKGNSICRRASWSGDTALSELAGTAVSIRFQMRDAKLYAFGFR